MGQEAGYVIDGRFELGERNGMDKPSSITCVEPDDIMLTMKDVDPFASAPARVVIPMLCASGITLDGFRADEPDCPG